MTLWNTFWRPVTFLYNGIFLVMFYVMTYFYRHNVLLSLWHSFFLHQDVFSILFHFMTHYLTLWRTLSHSNIRFDIMTYFLKPCHMFWQYYVFFDFMTLFLMSWRIFHIFGSHDLVWDFTTYFLTLWCTFWRYEVLFEHNTNQYNAVGIHFYSHFFLFFNILSIDTSNITF